MGSETVVLTGDASFGRSGITLKAMMKILRKEGQGFLIEFNHLGAISQEVDEMQGQEGVPGFLAPLIQQYKNVFNLPKRLPPARHIDHNIMLKEVTDPVNVRPIGTHKLKMKK